MTAITAITAQNTTGVASIIKIPTKKFQDKSSTPQKISNLM